jgi:homoserine O-acetyltransferase/O-succinyltransferase
MNRTGFTDRSCAIFEHGGSFALESGTVLDGYHLAYHVFGRMNEQKDNVVWIFHALTANSDARVWWPGLVGEGQLFDPARYFIVCVNMPGSCYGSIGPLDVREGQPSHHDFPFFTIRDMVNAYKPLRDFLGIGRIKVGIGGSMGGQQLLEWAVSEPGAFEYIIPIATSASHSAWGKAFNASQRWCIESDPSWKTDSPEAGLEGMKIARSVALLSYRHYQTYEQLQSDEDMSLLVDHKAASYQRYQGEKLASRFNAYSYHCLSRSMDSHHVGRHFASAAEALARVRAKVIIIGLRSDILFPLVEQEWLAAHLAGASFSVIDSMYGHDGFLLEAEAIGKVIRHYFSNDTNNSAASFQEVAVFRHMAE